MSKHIVFKTFIAIIFIVMILFLVFFYINKTKKIKIGNNTSSQEIIENILNISSYETVIEAEINSNKNTNKYLIKQKYIAPDVSEQEILEPENIKGIKIIKKENELKLTNTKLNISKIYNNYQYMTDNCMDLNTFINDYKTNKKKENEEKNNEILLHIENQNSQYTRYRTLYISKETGKPTKMEIKDNSKKKIIYILYREVKFKN